MIRRKRNAIPRIVGAAAFAVFAGACVASTEVELSELAGRWNVGEAVYIGVVDAEQTARLSERGFSATMDIAADGAFNMVITGGMVDALTGQFAVDGNELEVTIDGRVFPGEVFIEDDRAVLRILGGGVMFDFDEDGDEEAALLFFDYGQGLGRR